MVCCKNLVGSNDWGDVYVSYIAETTNSKVNLHFSVRGFVIKRHAVQEAAEALRFALDKCLMKTNPDWKRTVPCWCLCELAKSATAMAQPTLIFKPATLATTWHFVICSFSLTITLWSTIYCVWTMMKCGPTEGGSEGYAPIASPFRSAAWRCTSWDGWAWPPIRKIALCL